MKKIKNTNYSKMKNKMDLSKAEFTLYEYRGPL